MTDTLSPPFLTKDRVRYIPGVAYGDKDHEACEDGTISSVLWRDGAVKTVFVKFDKQVNKLGWDGTTAQGCTPTDLIVLKRE